MGKGTSFARLIRKSLRTFLGSCCYGKWSSLFIMIGLLAWSEARANETSLLEQLTQPVLSDAAKDQIFLRAMDHPRALTRELSSLWRQSLEQKNNILQSRIAWVMARIWYEDLQEEFAWDMDTLFRDAASLAERGQLAVSFDEIRFYQFEYEMTKRQSLLVDTKAEVIQLARQIQDPRIKAYALAKLAFYLADRGLRDELPMLLNEVRVLTGPSNRIPSPMEMDTYTALSLTLETIGQTAEAKAIDHLLDKACESMTMRNLCSLRAYNQGRKILEQNEVESIPEAKTHFLKSLELAKEIDEKNNLAQSYYGLNLAHNKSQNYSEAIPFGKKAAELFEQMGDLDWAASALTHLSSSYLKVGQADQALAAAQRARTICPPEFKTDLAKIHRQLSEVQASLKQFDAAYQSLNAAVQLEQTIRTEDARKEYLELRNQTLSLQNEMQDQQIQLLKKFRLVSFLAAGLSLGLCVALALVWRQSRALRRSRQKIKDILDHIDEGIVILDRHLRIKSGYSPYLDKMFDQPGRALQGKGLLDLLFPMGSRDADRSVLVKETLLSCLGEQSLSWEINEAHLPHEIVLHEATLEIHWQPLYSSHQLITNYLVTIRDISSVRLMQRQMELEAQRVKTLQIKLEEILKGNSNLIRFLFQDLQKSWDQLGRELLLSEKKTEVLRRLHTWKGAARSLGLNDLASKIHETESCVIALQRESRTQLEESWQSLSLAFQDYQHLLNTLLVDPKSEAGPMKNLYAFADLYAREMRDRLDAARCPQIGVMVLDHVAQWNPEVLPRIHDMLVHALANALDHGFIRPSQKQKVLEPALIQILAYESKGQLLLEVRDNGAGLDWQKLKQKASELAFVPKPDRSYTDVLFLDGVSTAESLSATSGRGVGLSSIRHLCEELGGQIRLEDNPSGGVVLTMEFPLSQLVKFHEARPKLSVIGNEMIVSKAK